MAELVDPFLEIKWGYAIGEDGWGDGVNENLIKLGFFANKRIDGEVAELPLIAQEGEAYFLQPDQRVYFYANATWYSSPVPEGTIFIRKSDGVRFRYTGEPILERVLEVSKEDIDGLNINAKTVNGHTVESSVPPDAKFTDTTYTIKDGELSEINFTSERRDKLAGIEAGAQVNNISDANANALVNGQSNNLHYHASDRNRANHTGTQAISTIDNLQTELDDRVKQDDPRLSDAREWTATIVSQAEAEAGSSSTARKWTAQRVRQAITAWWTGFSSAIGKALATAPDAASARSTIGAVADSDPRLSDSREWTASTVSQAEAEAGTATTRRAWTAQRVRQAIAAWWNGYSSSIGKSLATAQTAQEARQVIGAIGGSGGGDGDLGEMAFLDKATYAQQMEGSSDNVGTTPLGVKRYVEQYGLGATTPPDKSSLQGVRNAVVNITSGDFGVDASNIVGNALVLSASSTRSQAFWTSGHPNYGTRILYKSTNDNWETDSGVVELWTDANFNPDTKANRSQRVNLDSSRNITADDLEKILFPTASDLTLTIVNLGADNICVPLVITTGAYAMTLQAGSGFSIRWLQGGSFVDKGSYTIARYSMVTLYQANASEWRLAGNGIS